MENEKIAGEVVNSTEDIESLKSMLSGLEEKVKSQQEDIERYKKAFNRLYKQYEHLLSDYVNDQN